jgi:hypothetical protein
MKRKWPCALLLLVLLSIPAVAYADDGGYQVNWWTIDGGSATSSSGDYALSGSLGQPDTALLTGGGFTLQGGYWSGAVALPYSCLLFPIYKNSPTLGAAFPVQSTGVPSQLKGAK